MLKWLIKLKGEVNDLQDLADNLNSPEFKIIKEAESYYLDSSEFNSLTLPEEVRERGRALIKILNSVSKFENNNFKDISEASVTLIKDDGTRHQYVFIESVVEFGTSFSVKVIGKDGIEIKNPRLPMLEKHLTIAQQNPSIIDALIFYNDDTWINLYKVYEIIRDDVGNHDKIIQNGWTTKHELSRFTQTAQSRAVLGDSARHASKKYIAPPQPMTHPEAKSLIKKILSQWIESKK